jgi:hypothetical protein
MQFLNQVSSGTALLVGTAATIPSVAYAAITEDFTGVAAGAALGVVALGLSIWRASNDQRLDALMKRLDRAEKEADEYRAKATKALDENAGLIVEVASMKAKLKISEAGSFDAT